MLDIKAIRDDPAALDAALARRGLPAASAEVLRMDAERRMAIAKVEEARALRNSASREIAGATRSGDEARAGALKAEIAGLKADLPGMEDRVRRAEADMEALMAGIPNGPLEEVPDGGDETGNVTLREVGARREFDFAPREHFVLGEALGMMDFEAAARMSGSRFVVTKGPLARLHRALAQFMLDLHVDVHGHVEVDPPLLVRDEAMFGTAQLPKFREDQFLAVRDGDREAGRNLWLVPTAEVPLTNLVRGRILDEADLPMRLVAATQCFRAEAGAAGRDARGMIRQHQFTKVELVAIATPEQAVAEHERMLGCVEEVLLRLGLPYRVVTLCAGDMGFSSRKTYDVEVWLPGQGRYREISSVSLCGDFQARRMDATCRARGSEAPRHVHTLNGSGVAVGRALVAVMENYQREDGAITVPAVLHHYMRGAERIEATCPTRAREGLADDAGKR